jgi:DNA-binding winged helix-turn-helix (wHTH) protein
MPKQDGSQRQSIFSFGPFALSLTERRLSKDGKPIELGGPAFDILIALVERAGQLVGKDELIAIVWPDTIVEEGSLRFHVASLRKALGDGESGARYVTTVYGGGYCLVAPVVRSDAEPAAMPTEAPSRLPHRLPLSPSRIVGHDQLLRNVPAQVKAERFVTIIGPGDIGKTTLAVAAGRALLAEFKGELFSSILRRFRILTSCRAWLRPRSGSFSPTIPLMALLRSFLRVSSAAPGRLAWG